MLKLGKIIILVGLHRLRVVHLSNIMVNDIRFTCFYLM
jgi:hypothetical protein